MKALWHSTGRFCMRLSAGILAAMYLLAPAGLILAATPKPTCQITVKPTSIQVGGSVTVTWTSTNATAGAITNIGNVGPSGSINLLPSSRAVTTYFGAFTGPGGTANCTASVAVSSGSTGGGSATIDTSAANTPNALGVPATLPSSQGNSGLVPCGYGPFDPRGNDAASSTGCQACNLAQLIQNLMTFAIGIAIPIAAALFAYAGVLMFTAADDTGKITKAKGIFKDAFIGFLIAITAWLVINTLLHVIFSQGTFSSGNWFTIECTSGQRQVNNSITKVLSSLPITAGNTGQIPSDSNGVSAGGYASGGTPSGGSDAMQSAVTDALTSSCTAGDQQSCTALDAGISRNVTDAQVEALNAQCDAGIQLSCDALSLAIPVSAVSGNNTDCSAGNIQAAAASGGYNLTDQQASVLSCIAIPESACGRDTSIARTPSGQPTSATGMFQIILGINDQCHNLNIPVCTDAANQAGYELGGNLNCSQHFRGGLPIDNIGQACRAAANNISCNASAAACLVQNNRSSNQFSDWTADSRASRQAQCITNG